MRKRALICFLFTLCFTHSFGVVTWNDFMKKAEYMTTQLHEKLKPFILLRYPFNDVSEQCTKSLIRYADGLKKWDYWAVNMFDVTGKPPSSFFRGTNIDFGSFDDCIEIEVSKNEVSDSFKGQFCMLHMQSPLIGPMNLRKDNGTSYLEKYGHPPAWISETMKFDGLLRKFGLYLGICVPSTCSEKDIINIVTACTKPFELNVSLSDCQINEPKKWSLSAKLSLLVIFGLVVLCSIGTYLDSDDEQSKNNNVKDEDKSLVKKMLTSFSLSTNWDDLCTISEKKHSLSYLPGIKFWLCMWITFGHAFPYETYWKEKRYTNYLNVVEMMTPITIIIENATSVVEYYFCISGFLLTYTLWKKLERNNGNINFKEIIMQKICRLAPVHVFLMILLFIFPMTLKGPIWNSTWNEELRKCYDYGWSNLFFLQNFQNYSNICWLHTWYIAASFQIQIVSILLLVLIYKYPKTGIICGVLLNIGCYWHDFYTSYSNRYLLPSLKAFEDFGIIRDYLTDMYLKPYSHVASHTIGMVLGWLVMKGYRVPEKYHIPLWILYFPASILLLFTVYYPTQNILLIAFHNTFRNTIQTLLFTWLLYTCTTGSAGYVGKFFSFSFYTPMDRISYCIYLLHPIIIVFFNADLRERVYMSKIEHSVEGFAVVLASVILATIGYLIVEQPFNKIYDLCFKNKSHITVQKSEKLMENGMDEIKNQAEKKEL